MTDIGLMVRSANPVPDDSQALTDDELSAVLLLAQQRSTDMDTKERITQPRSAPRWRGWAIAAASFAAVVLVVGVVWLLGGTDADETPPATTPTTTPASTTSVPPTTTVAAGASEADVAATLAVWNQGTEEAVRSTLADGVRVDSSTLDEIIFWTLVGQEWTVVECSTDSTPTIRCTTENANPLYEAVGYQPWVWEISMRVEGGAVTSLSASPVLNRPDFSDDFAEAWFAYRDWLAENHPEAAEAISFPLEPGMADPFVAHLAEFAAAGGSSAASAFGDLTAEQVVIVESLVDAYNGMTYGDQSSIDAFVNLISPSARVRSSMYSGSASDERFRSEQAFRAAMDYHLTLDGCRIDLGAVTCQLESRSSEVEIVKEWSPAGLRLEIEDGVVTQYILSEDFDAFAVFAWDFYPWIAENYPEATTLMHREGAPGTPKTDEESIELWLELLPEYKAELGL